MLRFKLSLNPSVPCPRVPTQSLRLKRPPMLSTAFFRPPLQCGLLSTCHFVLCEPGSGLLDDRERLDVRYDPEPRDCRRCTRVCAAVLFWWVVWCRFAPMPFPLIPFAFPAFCESASTSEAAELLCDDPGRVSPCKVVKGLVLSERGVAVGVTCRDLSFKSSTILLRGPVGLCGRPCRPAGAGGRKDEGACAAFSSGDGGVESPRTTVAGRKREAIITLECLSELIVAVDDGKAEKDGADDDERHRVLWKERSVLICDVTGTWTYLQSALG